jgi:RimJ/RimL family protein N-acetyltransferase
VLRAGMALFDERGFGQWAVFLKSEPPLIGFCGFRLRDSTPELLYGLAQPYWGQGLATEAARAVLRHGFEHCGLTRIVAATDPPNQASVRVLEHLGMHPRGREVQHEVEVLCYEIDCAGFESSASA